MDWADVEHGVTGAIIERRIDADAERETPWADATSGSGANRAGAPDAAFASAFAQSDVSAETCPRVLDWSQRQADALTLLAETMLARGACSRHGAHLLHVHVDISTLCAPDGEGRSAIEDGPAIPPETLRRLGCDAALVTWIEDAAGKTLDVGRKTRVLSAGLRRALEQRDTRCRFPACEQRGFLDAHHIEHWPMVGRRKWRNWSRSADAITARCTRMASASKATPMRRASCGPTVT